MTPFLQLRLWWRRASSSTRVTTSVSLALAIALVVWVAVPTGTTGETTAAPVAQPAPGAPVGGVQSPIPGAPNAPAPGATTPAGPAQPVGPGGVPAAQGPSGGTGNVGGGPGAIGPAAPTGPTRAGCGQAARGTPGITAKTITLGFGYLALAGPIGNTAVGVATPEELQRIARAVVADINARGGVQCRSLALRFYEGNPLNPDQTRATCADIGRDPIFFLVDGGAFVYPLGAIDCVAQQKVPAVAPTMLLNDGELDRFPAYLASVSSDADTAMRDVALGLKQRGWFDSSKGFKKLGLLYEDCTPEMTRRLDTWLAKAGINPKNPQQVSKYVFQCPSSGFASPSEMSAAVSQFKLAGVTHVIPITGGGSFSTSFTQIAERQQFKPKYALTDYNGIIITTGSSMQPNADNFDRSIAITTGEYGVENVPGFPLDAGTKRCQKIIQKAGLAPSYVFGKQGGTVCAILWAAEAALKGTRALARSEVLRGLFNAGEVQLSYPFPNTTYKAPSKFYDGDTWATVQWFRECGCWHAVERRRHPSFPK